MHPGPRRAIDVLVPAVLLGVLGDVLLRVGPWGVNLPLWMGAALAGVWLLRARSEDGATGLTAWSLLPAAFFALCVAWRGSSELQPLNLLAILLALSLPALQAHPVRLRLARLSDYVLGFMTTGVNAAGGALRLLPEEIRRQVASERGRRTRAVSIGFLLALPVLVVFGGLLMSADPGFERMIRSLLDWDFETIASHVFIAGFVTWISIGYLLPLATNNNPLLRFARTTLANAPRPPALGMVELGIPLGTLSLIFLLFVVLQGRYLFGGEAVILQTAGLTFAEYARGGFFQLVAAAALLLPVLLGADWLLDRNTPRTVTAVRALSGLLLLLIGLIMASAVLRMRLYMGAYGLTHDRLFALTFLIWVAVVLAAFAGTVLRGRPDRFAFAALATGFLTLATLNIMNPDAVVARVNLGRAEAGAELDVEYASRLHVDAIPELVARAPALLSGDQCEMFWKAIDRWAASDPGDWRTWNVGRAAARRAVAGLGARGCP